MYYFCHAENLPHTKTKKSNDRKWKVAWRIPRECALDYQIPCWSGFPNLFHCFFLLWFQFFVFIFFQWPTTHTRIRLIYKKREILWIQFGIVIVAYSKSRSNLLNACGVKKNSIYFFFVVFNSFVKKAKTFFNTNYFFFVSCSSYL